MGEEVSGDVEVEAAVVAAVAARHLQRADQMVLLLGFLLARLRLRLLRDELGARRRRVRLLVLRRLRHRLKLGAQLAELARHLGREGGRRRA